MIYPSFNTRWFHHSQPIVINQESGAGTEGLAKGRKCEQVLNAPSLPEWVFPTEYSHLSFLPISIPYNLNQAAALTLPPPHPCLSNDQFLALWDCISLKPPLQVAV